MKKILQLVILLPFPSFGQVPNMLKDLNPGSGGSSINWFSSFPNNDVIFGVSNPVISKGLWKTDGSTAGTNKYKANITPSPISLCVTGGYVSTGFIDYLSKKFFTSNTPGYIWWKTNGTAPGTDSIAAANLLSANFAIIMNNIIYFSGQTTAEGKELWRTDGTSAGTYLVKDIWSGTNSGLTSNFSGFYVYNNELYFMANDGINGEELWKSDGTSAGTVLLKDINPGSNASNVSAIKPAANGVYFVANDGVVGAEPWFTNGTTAGTNLITDLNAGVNGSFGTPTIFNGNNVYFFYNLKLIKTNGTAAGTSSITVSQTPISSLYLFNNVLHYVAKVSAAISDTFKIKSVDLGLANQQTIKSFHLGNSLSPIKALFNQTANSKMVITLWGINQTNLNYLILSNGTVGNGKIFLNACQGADYTSGYSIKFDSLNNKLYFPTSYNTSNGVEPGYIDVQNDTLIQTNDLTGGSASSYYFSAAAIWNLKLYRLNNKNYFIANTPATGEEFYETDLTSAGTFLLKDIYPGNSSFCNPGAPASNYLSFGSINGIVTSNNIYFAANDGVNGLELWSFINYPTAINENSLNAFHLSLFPNPAKESLSIRSDAIIKSIIMNDVLGKTIKEIYVSDQSEIFVNTSDIKQGVYFVTIKTEKGTITKKVIKD